MPETTLLLGGALTFEQSFSEREFPFEATGITGMALILEMSEAEKIVQETTQINGMSITYKDYPLYAFQWTETRFL